MSNILQSKPNQIMFTNSSVSASQLIQFNGNLINIADSFINKEAKDLKKGNNIINNLVLAKRSDGFYGLNKSVSTSYNINGNKVMQIKGVNDYFGLNEDINQFSKHVNKRDVGCEQYAKNQIFKNINIKRGPVYLTIK